MSETSTKDSPQNFEGILNARSVVRPKRKRNGCEALGRRCKKHEMTESNSSSRSPPPSPTRSINLKTHPTYPSHVRLRVGYSTAVKIAKDVLLINLEETTL
jgi:hypothetical protein